MKAETTDKVSPQASLIIVNPSLRFYSPNLRFIWFSSGQMMWARKDFKVVTEADSKEAREVFELFMEDEAGNA